MSYLTELADRIENAGKGDIIVVRSEAALQLAERARARMCPEKDIIFQVQTREEIDREIDKRLWGSNE